MTSAERKTRMLECLCCWCSALKIFKYLCFFTRCKLFGGSEYILLIFLMPAALSKCFLSLFPAFFVFLGKTIYDYNVFMMSWPLMKYPLVSWAVLHVLKSTSPDASVSQCCFLCCVLPMIHVYIFPTLLLSMYLCLCIYSPFLTNSRYWGLLLYPVGHFCPFN